jgi:hypothetical protein
LLIVHKKFVTAGLRLAKSFSQPKQAPLMKKSRSLVFTGGKQ